MMKYYNWNGNLPTASRINVDSGTGLCVDWLYVCPKSRLTIKESGAAWAIDHGIKVDSSPGWIYIDVPFPRGIHLWPLDSSDKLSVMR